MWTSVPQIDATFTRIRTSVGPSDGIGTVRISVLFGAGFDFTAAFMVDVIPNFHRPGPLMDPGYFNFLSFPSFGLEGRFPRSGPPRHRWTGCNFDMRQPTRTNRYSRARNSSSRLGSPVSTRSTGVVTSLLGV